MANDASSNPPPSTEARLAAATRDARSVAGDSYFAGARVDAVRNNVDVYLMRAPQSVVSRIEEMHPGVCVHNDAPNTLRNLLALMQSIDLAALRSEGIEVVRLGPTCDGHLIIGVTSDVHAAELALAEKFGSESIRVHAAQPVGGLPYPPRHSAAG